MKGKTPNDYPAVKGLAWHRDQYYSFFTPIDWCRFSWLDGTHGEIYGPDPADPLTVFAVAVKDLGMRVTSDDLDALAEGFFETIEQLSGSVIETRNQQVDGTVLELEAKYTFQEQGSTRKCWIRVFYHGTRQIAMTAQGATSEKYDHWLPWFFEAMMTARVHSTRPESPY